MNIERNGHRFKFEYKPGYIRRGWNEYKTQYSIPITINVYVDSVLKEINTEAFVEISIPNEIEDIETPNGVIKIYIGKKYFKWEDWEFEFKRDESNSNFMISTKILTKNLSENKCKELLKSLGTNIWETLEEINKKYEVEETSW